MKLWFLVATVTFIFMMSIMAAAGESDLPSSPSSYAAWAIAERFIGLWYPLGTCVITDKCCCHNDVMLISSTSTTTAYQLSVTAPLLCSDDNLITSFPQWSITNTTRLQSGFSLFGIISYADISSDYNYLTITGNTNDCSSRLVRPTKPSIPSSSTSVSSDVSSSSSTGDSTNTSNGNANNSMSTGDMNSSSISGSGDSSSSSQSLSTSISSRSSSTSGRDSSSLSLSSTAGIKPTTSSSSSSSGTSSNMPLSLLDGEYAFEGSDCTPNDACACGTGKWSIASPNVVSSKSSLTLLTSAPGTNNGVTDDIFRVTGEMYGGWGSSPSLMLRTTFDEPLTIVNATIATFSFVDQQFQLHALVTSFVGDNDHNNGKADGMEHSADTVGTGAVNRLLFSSLPGCNSVALRVSAGNGGASVVSLWGHRYSSLWWLTLLLLVFHAYVIKSAKYMKVLSSHTFR